MQNVLWTQLCGQVETILVSVDPNANSTRVHLRKPNDALLLDINRESFAGELSASSLGWLDLLVFDLTAENFESAAVYQAAGIQWETDPELDHKLEHFFEYFALCWDSRSQPIK